MRLHEEFGLSVSDDTIYRALHKLAVHSEGYDWSAWEGIHKGEVVGSCGKARMISTKPKQ
jgi:hypothetical protein